MLPLSADGTSEKTASPSSWPLCSSLPETTAYPTSPYHRYDQLSLTPLSVCLCVRLSTSSTVNVSSCLSSNRQIVCSTPSVVHRRLVFFCDPLLWLQWCYSIISATIYMIPSAWLRQYDSCTESLGHEFSLIFDCHVLHSPPTSPICGRVLRCVLSPVNIPFQIPITPLLLTASSSNREPSAQSWLPPPPAARQPTS